MATFLRGRFAHHEDERKGTRLASWLIRKEERRDHELVKASAVLETGRSLPRQTPALDKARGVPIIGAGRGAIVGSAPDVDVPNRLERLRKRLED